VERSAYLFGDDVLGIEIDAVEWEMSFNADVSFDTPHNGVGLELSFMHIKGSDNATYGAQIMARLSWRDAARLHDYLGVLLRQHER
jgi:hypothetical protein